MGPGFSTPFTDPRPSCEWPRISHSDPEGREGRKDEREQRRKDAREQRRKDGRGEEKKQKGRPLFSMNTDIQDG